VTQSPERNIHTGVEGLIEAILDRMPVVVAAWLCQCQAAVRFNYETEYVLACKDGCHVPASRIVFNEAL